MTKLKRKWYVIWSRALYLLREAPTLIVFFLACGFERLKRGKPLDADTLAQLTSKHILHGKLRNEDRLTLLDVLTKKQLSPWAFPLSFFRLPDSLEKKYMKDLSLQCHDRARKHLVRRVLPRALRVLDIGGAVDVHPEGALIGMGSHRHGLSSTAH